MPLLLVGELEYAEACNSTTFWLSVPYPPKVLADVVEALIVAIFVDSKFDYNVVLQSLSHCY